MGQSTRTKSKQAQRGDLFQPLESTSTSERVAAAIRRIIVRGQLRAGENLPPERILAERFAVTRNTVREALRKLEQVRLVSVRQGSGITVQDYLGTAGLEFVVDLLSSAEDGTPLMHELAEARSVIGQAMAHHAIDRLSAEALPPLREAVNAFAAEARRTAPDVRRLQELDYEVHRQLTCAGGNRALVLLHNSMRHIYRHVAGLFEPLMARPTQVSELYTELLESLEQGERGQAKAAITRYFEQTTAALAAAAEGKA